MQINPWVGFVTLKLKGFKQIWHDDPSKIESSLEEIIWSFILLSHRWRWLVPFVHQALCIGLWAGGRYSLWVIDHISKHQISTGNLQICNLYHYNKAILWISFKFYISISIAKFRICDFCRRFWSLSFIMSFTKTVKFGGFVFRFNTSGTIQRDWKGSTKKLIFFKIGLQTPFGPKSQQPEDFLNLTPFRGQNGPCDP